MFEDRTLQMSRVEASPFQVSSVEISTFEMCSSKSGFFQAGTPQMSSL
jgi:hypothetical protein